MDVYLQFLLLGVGAGAVYAGTGLGLVLAYQGSGVINFAHGGMMMYSTYVYDELRDTGDYVFPVIGLPARVNVASDGTSLPVALTLALLTAAALGLVVHVLVFRPLRTAPLLAKVVASVGIMITIQAVVVLRFGSQNESVQAILPNESVDVLGTSIPQDRLWLVLIVAVVALALAGLYRLTRFGLATRAAASHEKGAILLGYSPSLLAAGNWVLASLVAAVFGILTAPISGLTPITYTLLVVPALAVALVGRLQSFLITAAAGLALGMFQSELLKIQRWSWFPDWGQTGVREGLPFLVIIAVLFIGGRALPSRGAIVVERQPFAVMPRHVTPTVVALSSVGLVFLATFESSLRLNLYYTMAAAIIALSIVVLTGYVGQVSLAQAVFAGMSGFVLAKLAANAVPFPIAPLLGAAAATVLGVAVGVPALRIRGAQLAVVTLAAGVAIEAFVFKNPSFVGGTGALRVDEPSLFGLDLAASRGTDFNRWEFGLLLMAMTIVSCLMVVNLRRSSTGRRFLAVRANERAAAAAGVDVARTKLLAFGLSSFLAGLGGAMLAYLRGVVSSDSFGIFVSLTLVAFAYLGGIASVAGAVVAGLIAPGGLVVGLIDKVVEGGKYSTLVGGLTLILTAVLNPDGVVGKISSDLRSKPAVASPDS